MELARAAVEARLAACSQVAGPAASTYWWNDEIERAEEWFVFFKTTGDRCDELISFVAERHSYDEPEIIAVPIVAGVAAYLDWLREETLPDSADDEEDSDEGSDDEDLGEEAPAEAEVTPRAGRSRSR
jgi:periplasmic divalent cation tolerance protein